MQESDKVTIFMKHEYMRENKGCDGWKKNNVMKVGELKVPTWTSQGIVM